MEPLEPPIDPPEPPPERPRRPLEPSPTEPCGPPVAPQGPPVASPEATIPSPGPPLEPPELLVVRRVHELDGRSQGTRDRQAARSWWLRASLPQLLGDGELPQGLQPAALRRAAFASIDLSAARIAAARRVLASVLERFERYRELEPKLSRWCRALAVATWGSTATFDALPGSDLDVAVVVESDRLDRCEFVVQALVVWPWKLELLADEEARAAWPSGLDLDDPSMPFAERRALAPGSHDPRKYEELAVLATNTLALSGHELLARVLEPYVAAARPARRELALAWQRRLRRVEGKLDSGRPDADFWRRWLSAVRSYLLVLGLLHLEPPEWGLNYFATAERLGERRLLDGSDWAAVRSAALWTLHARGSWETRPVEPRQARAALRSFRALRRLVDARVGQPVGRSGRAPRR